MCRWTVRRIPLRWIAYGSTLGGPQPRHATNGTGHSFSAVDRRGLIFGQAPVAFSDERQIRFGDSLSRQITWRLSSAGLWWQAYRNLFIFERRFVSNIHTLMISQLPGRCLRTHQFGPTGLQKTPKNVTQKNGARRPLHRQLQILLDSSGETPQGNQQISYVHCFKYHVLLYHKIQHRCPFGYTYRITSESPLRGWLQHGTVRILGRAGPSQFALFHARKLLPVSLFCMQPQPSFLS